MRNFKTVFTMMALAGLLVFSGSGFAAKGGIQGPPTDGGGGAPDLGDLIVLYRDAWGLPFLTEDLCQQPLAAPGETLPAVDPYIVCTSDQRPGTGRKRRLSPGK